MAKVVRTLWSVRNTLGRELWWTKNRRKAEEWARARNDASAPAPDNYGPYGVWRVSFVVVP